MRGFAVCVKDAAFVNWQGMLVDKLEYALVVQDEKTLQPLAAMFAGGKVVPVEAPDKGGTGFRGTFFEWRVGLE